MIIAVYCRIPVIIKCAVYCRIPVFIAGTIAVYCRIPVIIAVYCRIL